MHLLYALFFNEGTFVCCICTFEHVSCKVKLDASALLNAPNLTELLLNNNLIDDVPLEVGALLKLKLIDVGCNNLQSMPTGLGYLPDLTRIVYAGNPCEVGRRCGAILAD